MRFLKTLSVAFFGVLLMYSCSLDSSSTDPMPVDPVDPEPEESILSEGFFVVNEGQFPNPGSISFMTYDLQISENGIYQTVNGPDEDLGSGLQSLFFDSDRLALIVSNGANLITAVDRYTFEKKAVIEGGLDVPRYGVVVGNKAFVTNQGDFESGDDDYVAVIDLSNLTVENQITVGSYVEHIFEGVDGRLYIEGAAFGEGNEIAILDPSSEEIVGTIETADALNSIVLDDQFIYALTAEKLQKFDLGTGNLEAEVDLDYEGSPDKLRYENGVLYYTVGTQVFEYDADFEGGISKTPVVQYASTSELGAMYGFEVREGNFYVADAGDFASSGFIEIFSPQGASLGRFNVGVGPNGFYFNGAPEGSEEGPNQL